MSTAITREQVQQLLDQATPGPWDTDGDSVGADEEWIVHAPKFDREPRTTRAADLALIAAAPDVFRWALERDQAAEVQKKALDDATDALKGATGQVLWLATVKTPKGIDE